MVNLNITELEKTFNGEFPFPGKLVTLVRFKHCNLNCSFCDTDNLMKIDTPPAYKDENEFTERFLKYTEETNNIMFTGGEPGLYLDDIHRLIDLIFKNDILLNNVQIETNGLVINRYEDFIMNTSEDVMYVILREDILNIVWSPKFINSKEINENFNRLYSSEFRKLLNYSYIKIVDIPQWEIHIDKFLKVGVKLYGLNFLNRVGLMYPTGLPEFNEEDLIKRTLERCLKYNVNFSPRLQMIYNFK